MHVSLVVHPRCEEITWAYPTQKLGSDTIGDGVDYLTAILSWVYVYAEGSFPDGFGDGSDMRVRRHRGGKDLLDLII
jgi:hypothetical protein